MDTCGFTDYPVTMVAWVYLTGAVNQTVLAFGDQSGTNSYQRIYLRDPTDIDVVAFSRDSTVNAWTDTTTSYTTSAWNHVAAVFTSDTLRESYLNGGGNQSDTTSIDFDATMDNTTIGALDVADLGPAGFVDGYIAECALYNVALSAIEIGLLAKGFSPLMVRPDALVAYWPMVKDNTAEVARDIVSGYDLDYMGSSPLGSQVHPRIYMPSPVYYPMVEQVTPNITLHGTGGFTVTPTWKVRPSGIIMPGRGGFTITPSITNVYPQGGAVADLEAVDTAEHISTKMRGAASGHDPRFNEIKPVIIGALQGGTPEAVGWEDTGRDLLATVMDDTQFWFEKTHLLPKVVQELGTVASAQTFPVELHNADRENSITVTAIIDNLGSDISIATVPATPFDIAPQASLCATVTVERSGTLLIDASYSFVTTAGTYTFYITGTRIVLLPIRPQAPMREHLLFDTTIMEATDGTEQRVANRKVPRSMYEFTINSDRKRMEMLLFDRQNKLLATPAWHEPSFISSAVTAADMTVNVDNTAYGNFYVGGYAIIFKDEYNYDALEIASMTPTSLTFTSEISADYPVNTQVMPLMLAYVQATVVAQKNLNNVQTFNLELTVDGIDNDIASAAGFSTRNSKPFLDGPNMVDSGTLQETLVQNRLVLDHRTGLFDYFSQWKQNKRSSVKGFKTNTRQELWEFRQFLHYLRGKQVSFYIPTFTKDLVPNQALISANTAFIMDHIGYGINAQGRDPKAEIRIWLKNGTLLERTIVAYAELSASEEQLTMNTTWPYDIQPEDIERIEFVEKVRLDVDDITITHYNALGQTRTFIPTVEVFD
jgi:hypothetical protein